MRRRSAASCGVIGTAVGGAAAREGAANGVVDTAKTRPKKARRLGVVAFFLMCTRFSTNSDPARALPGAIS